jgi:DNA-directed RNA polymerase subunit M/transcription elongation factor TFIIS
MEVLVARNRGKVVDTDLKALMERNAQLERDLRAARRDNNRLRKERNKWRDVAEAPSLEVSDVEVVKKVEDRSVCIKCGSEDLTYFDLQIRGTVKKYYQCKCGKRGRM